jgi:thiosulfate/3-mercaptopyruvate sulfurtransferase
VQVVVYDIGPDFFASRLWWTLRYLGHHAVAVLDGGFQAWLQMGYPTRAGEEHRVPKTFIARPRPEMLVTTDAVPAVRRLIDARAPERYRGETEPIDPVAGHIPGAVNYDWKNSLDATGRMLAPEVLRQRLGHVLGDMPPSAAAVYCGSGVSSCHVLLAMAVAGLDGARLYAGSWSEWCSNPSRPFDQGAG